MLTAKLFNNGGSQAVRLPKNYRFEGNEVSVNKIGDVVILMPKTNKWASMLIGLEMFTDDVFSEGRAKLEFEERASF